MRTLLAGMALLGLALLLPSSARAEDAKDFKGVLSKVDAPPEGALKITLKSADVVYNLKLAANADDATKKFVEENTDFISEYLVNGVASKDGGKDWLSVVSIKKSEAAITLPPPDTGAPATKKKAGGKKKR
jgi:hypothetical protein